MSSSLANARPSPDGVRAARVLLVLPSRPHPLTSGGHLRDWQILNLLARRGLHPHVLHFGAGEGERLAPDGPVHALAAGVTDGGPRRERPDAGPMAIVRRKLSYLTGTGRTHPFAHQYDAVDAGSTIVRTAQRVGADTVIVRSFWCHLVPRLRTAGLRVVVNCPDANVRLAREMVRATPAWPNPLAKLGPVCNWAQVRRLERRHLAGAAEIWVPTASERDELVASTGAARVLVLPNLVDVRAMPDCSSDEGEPDTVLFVASFAYRPNANAAARLLADVLPRIRRSRPATRLWLVGGGMPEALRARALATPGVEVPGFVADLEPWYRRAAVVALPVREGAGTLFKTIEALALGKATVGFPESYRGIPADTESAFLTVAGPDGFAHAAAGLLADGSARRVLGGRARALAAARLSWEVGAACLDRSVLATTT